MRLQKRGFRQTPSNPPYIQAWLLIALYTHTRTLTDTRTLIDTYQLPIQKQFQETRGMQLQGSVHLISKLTLGQISYCTKDLSLKYIGFQRLSSYSIYSLDRLLLYRAVASGPAGPVLARQICLKIPFYHKASNKQKGYCDFLTCQAYHTTIDGKSI